jgi:dihydrofolate synthase/folylpolyglutamate synthase
MPKTNSASPGAGRKGPRSKVETRSHPVEVSVPSVPAAADILPVKPSEIDNYTSALRYLNERVNFEKTSPARVSPDAFKLDRMRALLEELGNPQKSVKCVHIAGSKGKGSTVEMTASCLSSCGYAVGVYTSPHLVDIRERIRINGEMISYPAFSKLCQKVAIAGLVVRKQHGEVTFFEIVTAMALCHFAEQAVDIAVVEVGLGGRLDATNCIEPEVTAITAIQLEHTQLLGDTVEKIAAEKAGIFKPGVTALTIPQAPAIMQVLRDAAASVGAPLEVLGTEVDFSYRVEASPELGPHARVVLTTPKSNFEHLPVPLKGEHQAPNCGLALAIVDKLRGRGFETPERKVAEGLARTPHFGRMEIAWQRPRILLDGAHTPDSIACLVKSVGSHIKYDSMIAIFGCAADKDVKLMLQKMAMGADKIIFTRASGNSRAMDPRELQRKYAEVGHKIGQVARNLPDALALAVKGAGRDDLICVTGSFYLVGEAKKHLQDLAAKGEEPGR